MPETKYVNFDTANFPFRFNRSVHSRVIRDSSFGAKPWFIHLVYPGYSGVLHVSHQNPKQNRDTLAKFFNTSLRLTGKHEYFASAINEYSYRTPKGYTAIISEIEGEVPSQFQYFVTDSSRNFFRVALYFPENRKNDSLAPVIEYLKKDMLEILNSVEWK
jgi:gliding motility-associated lipoprotein GldD